VSTADNNDKNNANRKQTRGRIFRAKDIIPGASKSNSEKTVQGNKSTEQAPNIPKFDLADEIMAKHREITAIRRKAPGKKADAQHLEQQAKSDVDTIEQPITSPLEEQIIADIVERDIRKFCCAYITN